MAKDEKLKAGEVLEAPLPDVVLPTLSESEAAVPPIAGIGKAAPLEARPGLRGSPAGIGTPAPNAHTSNAHAPGLPEPFKLCRFLKPEEAAAWKAIVAAANEAAKGEAVV